MNARHITTTVAVGLSLALAGGVALAAIPGPDGSIKGCFDNNSGNLRVFDSQENMPRGCGRNETLLSWNQAGPSGPSGPQGAQGLQGERGPQGEQGLQGVPGTDGEDGQEGATGPSGPAGPPGVPGTPGQGGEDGEDGISGYEVVVEEAAARDLGANDEGAVTIARCPEGKVVIGGGAVVEAELPGVERSPYHVDITLTGSGPFDDPSGRDAWIASAYVARDFGDPWWLVVTAICANLAD
jgi:hypothetical protein